MKNIYLFLIIIIGCSVPGLHLAQEPQVSWSLQTPESNTKSYIARDYIEMKSGFFFDASKGNTFSAEVNPCLLFPSYADTYATEWGFITSDPARGAVVGNLIGSLDITPTGAATYNIPIPCSPGFNGMQPNISLAYNSQGGAGIAGWGWNIGGLSMISRVPKNYYFDNESSGMIWDKTSPLALDGQRLITVSTHGNDSVVYCTESETTVRIVGYDIQESGPSYFKVYLKNGNILQYGNPADLGSYYPISLSTVNGELFYQGEGTKYLGWALVKTTDRNSNMVEYSYLHDLGKLFSTRPAHWCCINTRIDKIEYGNEASGNKTIVGSVLFHYKEGSDKTVKYISGREVIYSKILNKIEVKGAASNLLESYALTYNSAENKDYLISIKKSNAAGEFIHPVKFEWNTSEYSQDKDFLKDIIFLNEPWEPWDVRQFSSYFICTTGDVNGDGLTDFVLQHSYHDLDLKDISWSIAINNGDGTATCGEIIKSPRVSNGIPVLKSPMLIDINQDGKDEFVLVGQLNAYDGSGSNQLRPAGLLVKDIETGLEFEYSTQIASAQIYNDISYPKDGGSNYLFTVSGDFLGNGNIQFLLFSKDNHIQGIIDPSDSNISKNIDLSSITEGHPNSNIYITDINGNGKSELMIVKGKLTYIYECSNGKFKLITTVKDYLFRYDDIIRIGDFNGDGNSDFLVGTEYDHYFKQPRKWEVYFSNGSSITKKEYGISDYLNWPQSWGDILVTDVNDDGRSDIIYASWHNNPEDRCELAALFLNGNGDEFERKAINTSYSDFGSYFKFELESMSNKPGGLEIMLHPKKCIRINKGKSLNKIEGITDSFGNYTSIDYQRTKNPFSKNESVGKYAMLDGGQYDGFVSKTPGRFEVVKSFKSTKNIDLSFKFESPYIHKQARGFLGFKKIQTQDSISYLSSVTESKINESFHIIYPYKITQKTTGGTLISEDISNYSFQDLGSEKYFLRLDSQISGDKLNNTSVTKTFSNYDDSRNPKKIVTDYGGGIKEEQTLEYIKNGSVFFNKTKSVTTTGIASGTPNVIRKIEYEYDGRGNLAKEVADPADRNETVTTYSDYDKWGNVGKISIKANGITRESVRRYTASGRFLASETNHLGETTSYNYDEYRGLLSSKNDIYGTTRYQYDNFGRLQKTIHPDKIEAVNLLQWAGSGSPSGAKYYELTEVSGSAPLKAWYDVLGREVLRETYGLNNRKILTKTEYDSRGRIWRVSEPYFENEAITYAARYSYDGYGRKSAITTPMGVASYNYSPSKVKITAPDGIVETVTNGAGQTVSETTNGKKVSYSYHASGLTKSATPEGGPSVDMEYDLQGNRTKLTDPDGGTITSRYDGWGQLLEVKQSVHNTGGVIITTYNYHPSGLLKEMIRNDEKTEYRYDWRNRTDLISIAGKHSQYFAYDNFDRVISRTENINNSEKILTTRTEYNHFGQVSKEVYPSGYYIRNEYDKSGILTEVWDSFSNRIWKAVASNAKGQIKEEWKGDVITKYGYDSRGFPTHVAAKGIVDMIYSFDSKGNMSFRWDNLTGYKEAFGYDEMNRLTNWNITRIGLNIKANNLAYHPVTGNISTRSDLGYSMNYGEDGKPPHAISSISGIPATLPHHEQDISYTDFKKVKRISEGDKILDILYGVDEQRCKTVYSNGSSTLSRYYSFNYEEEVVDGSVRKIHYISGGNGLAGVYVLQPEGATLYHAYTDYQGSLIALTLPDGSVQEKYAYDPWGKRRNPANWEQDDTRASLILDRGYTMHEHLDAFNLINMNGRVYDPQLGMFLSPDPYIQAPGNWLNYNRYGYCLNNPLKYTDPSGEIFALIIGAAIGCYVGGMVANEGSYNPTKWDWSSGETWRYMIGGAVIGGATAYAGAGIAASGMPLANTTAMSVSSFYNSLGMNILTKGEVPLGVNLGVASYNISDGEWGHLGKKENSTLENWGYVMGAMANASDILAGTKPVTGTLATENDPNFSRKGDYIGHSQAGIGNDVIIDWGPQSENGKLFNAPRASNSYKNGTFTANQVGKKFWDKQPIPSLNEKTMRWYGDILNKGGKYQLLTNSCVSQTSRALNLSGVFNIGLHPYLLHTQMFLRNLGVRPLLFLHYSQYNSIK